MQTREVSVAAGITHRTGPVALALVLVLWAVACGDMNGSDGSMASETVVDSVSFDCELVETMRDPSGRIEVSVYPLPFDAGVAMAQWGPGEVAVASGRHIFVIDTAREYCDSMTAHTLPSSFSALGESREMLVRDDALYIAYARGVVELRRDLTTYRVLGVFDALGDNPVVSTHGMDVVRLQEGPHLLVGGWDDFAELDEARLEQVYELYGGSGMKYAEAVYGPEDRAFTELMGNPLMLFDLTSGAVHISDESQTAWDVHVTAEGVYVANDFGPDLGCPAGDTVHAADFFESCTTTGGAAGSMSATPMPTEHEEFFGVRALADQGFVNLWVPEDRMLTILSARFGDVPELRVLPIYMDSVGQRGQPPVAWAMQPIETDGIEYLVASGRWGAMTNFLFGAAGLRDTCFSLYSPERLAEGEFWFGLGPHVCTDTEGLTSPSNLIPTDCPGTRPGQCFVGVPQAMPGNQRVIYMISVAADR